MRWRSRARGREPLSWRTLSVRRRLVEELSGEARGCGAGRAHRGAGGEEGRDRGRHTGRSESDSAGDLLQGGNRRRDGKQLSEGELCGREAGGWLGGLGEGKLDDETAGVPVVPEALPAQLEDPARSPALELGLRRHFGRRHRDEAVRRVLLQPVAGGQSALSSVVLLLLLLLLGRLLLGLLGLGRVASLLVQLLLLRRLQAA